MAYISTEHSVGDIVYAYDADSDTVQRLRIIGLRAFSESATRYGGEWHVDYVARPARALNGHLSRQYAGSVLHYSAANAFPAITPEVAPAPEQAEAA